MQLLQKNILLIVDDVEMNRAILRSIFEDQYEIMEAENGAAALKIIEVHATHIAAVLLDLMMPVMNGHQLLEEMGRRGYLTLIPVVIITAENTVDSEKLAFDEGAAELIKKPFEPGITRRRVKNVIELYVRKNHQEEIIEAQAHRLRETNKSMVGALASIIETRSQETGQHVKRISKYVEALLKQVNDTYPTMALSEDEIALIASAASLHDIGKVAIPDAILNKPGRLTPEEFDVIKTHSERGAMMLDNLKDLADEDYLTCAHDICLSHHERWDGGGYPHGLRGDEIPLSAQAAGIADCFDALTNDRVYKKAIEPHEAIEMIVDGKCGAFAPYLLEALRAQEPLFTRLREKYADDTRTCA